MKFRITATSCDCCRDDADEHTKHLTRDYVFLKGKVNTERTKSRLLPKTTIEIKDLDYSLERYNVIRRAYWVNGQREKAMSLPCPVTRPLGYIVLFSQSGAVVGRFVVDGKVSSLNSYLFPAEWFQLVEQNRNWDYEIVEIAGIDGCYGSNVSGIFFFTTDGKYIEWTGDFLYSDIPFTVDEPILKTEG